VRGKYLSDTLEVNWKPGVQMKYILAIDQGTTSSRAILFDPDMQVAGVAQQEIRQHYPSGGWVEHDPEDIWNSVVKTCREVLERAGVAPTDVVAIGITNQRETTVLWDRETGKAIYNAIVWQDRRTADECVRLKGEGFEDSIREKTGLLLDPYFSGTKVKWILDHVDGARARARNGDILFGTIDSFLLWRLTGGKVHATDATNAARTMLFDIRRGVWDADICHRLQIPGQILPEVKDCAAAFGTASASILGAEIPVCGIAGDQQAATVGQACFSPGMIKSTYGTGCFALLNTGADLVVSQNRMLGTIAYRLDGKTTYALEGSIFMAGATVQWLRDGLGILQHASETQGMAEKSDPKQDVYLVPAFTGLGAPYWDAAARAAIYGLSRNSGRNELARAALESVGYQTRDLLTAMRADWVGGDTTTLRVDGGMSANNWAMQFLSDVLDTPVDRPGILETTALGVAWLAGMQSGFYPGINGFAKKWEPDKTFVPRLSDDERARKYAGWKRAVGRTLS